MERYEYDKVKQVKAHLTTIINILDSMNDITFNEVNDFSDQARVDRFGDLQEWLYYLSTK